MPTELRASVSIAMPLPEDAFNMGRHLVVVQAHADQLKQIVEKFGGTCTVDAGTVRIRGKRDDEPPAAAPAEPPEPDPRLTPLAGIVGTDDAARGVPVPSDRLVAPLLAAAE
jgi:hypothetical protein